MITRSRRPRTPVLLTSAVVACAVALAGAASLGGSAHATSTDSDTAPTRVLTGISPVFDGAGAIDVAPDGRLYVADESFTVRVYPPGASGTAEAERTIELPGAKGFVDDLELDRSGYLYVADYTNDRISVYAPGASGDDAPARVIEGGFTGLQGPSAIAIGADGTLHVADYNRHAVLSFIAGADGDMAPTNVRIGPATTIDRPEGLAVDPVTGDLVVTSRNSRAVVVLGVESDGDVAPKRVIEGEHTLLDQPYAVDVDDAGNIYVGVQQPTYVPLAESDEEPVLSAVNVYAPGAEGDVAPVRRLRGAATGLDLPWDLEVTADRSVVVADHDADRVSTFAPLMPRPVVTTKPTSTAKPTATPKPSATEPGKVGGLRVRSASKGKARVIRWTRPSSDGGAPLTGYHVVIRKGGTKLVDRELPADKRSLKVRTKQLRKGKHVVAVAAASSAGTGDFVKRSFKVRKR